MAMHSRTLARQNGECTTRPCEYALVLVREATSSAPPLARDRHDANNNKHSDNATDIGVNYQNSCDAQSVRIRYLPVR